MSVLPDESIIYERKLKGIHVIGKRIRTTAYFKVIDKERAINSCQYIIFGFVNGELLTKQPSPNYRNTISIARATFKRLYNQYVKTKR